MLGLALLRAAAAPARGGGAASRLRAALSSGGGPPAPAGGAGRAGSKREPAPRPPVPDGTTLFRLANPELLLDPNRSHSWVIVGGVVAFFGAYLAYCYATDDFWTPKPQAGAAAAEVDPSVRKVLPDGRLLMDDGSIRRPAG